MSRGVVKWSHFEGGMVTDRSGGRGRRDRVKAGADKLDVTWSAARLLSLVTGAVVADAAGIRLVFWLGAALLALSGLLGLVLLGRHDFRRAPVTVS